MGLFGRMNAATGGDGGRSSTASHYSSDYASATAGVAADEFYGVPLKLDVYGDDFLFFGAFLLYTFVIQPKLPTPVKIASWGGVLAVAWSIKELTLYPLISTIVLTRTSYPWPLVVAHCITANANYRKEKGPRTNYLESFIMGFFCYGFGGTIVSDLMMGLPITALGHARIVPVWCFAWLLVWLSPNDVVYKVCANKNSALYYLISALVAVDTVVTAPGRVSRSARELQNKVHSPILAGMMCGIGGAILRYGDRMILRGGNEFVAENSFAAIESGFWRTLGYSVIWWYLAVYKCQVGSYDGLEDEADYHCDSYNGHNMDRFTIAVVHVAWNFGCDIGLLSGHPFTFLVWVGRSIGSSVAYHLGYGPPEMHRPDLYDEFGNLKRKKY